jgi:UDP-N-acetylglucosamine 4,6-dehydratase
MMFDDKAILITGGTGSFGHECVRVLLEHHNPRRIVIYSRDEFKQLEMRRRFSGPTMRYFLGDVRDRERLVQATDGIDYIIHAAALKQVPAAEYNPTEFKKTNIDGAENVIYASLVNNVTKIVALSTDKAVNPINLYGATKLVSEKLFIAANNLVGSRNTRFSVVRYGNVIGSRGSVVPFFRRLIDEGTDHIPITDIRMTRFWITLEQSVEFALKGFERMQGGEVFVPILPSIRIVDLAEAMAPHLSRKIVGIRAGEKINETMCPADDWHLTLEFSNHYVISPSIQFAETTDFRSDGLGALGKAVGLEFEYGSGTNEKFLSVDEIVDLNKTLGFQ